MAILALILSVLALFVIGVVAWLGWRCLLWVMEELADDSAFLMSHQQFINRVDAFLSSPNGIVDVIRGKLSKSTDDAACYDVYSAITVQINPGESVVVPTGLVTEMWGVDALLFDRSGLAAKFRVTRRAGVIDAKYPDEWGVVLVNEGQLPYQVKAGDRIAQAMFVPKFAVDVKPREGGEGVVEVSGEVRTGGFGSTGA